MKTTISKESILKSSILFFTITAFILSALLFTSCSDTESVVVSDDEELIEKIESADKTTIEEASLPSATSSVLNGDLADSFVETVQLATELGYQVALVSDNLSFEETKTDVFFSLQGRQLNSTSSKRGKHRSKCFEFVYPIDLIMPDDSSITLNSADDWSLKKDWYAANPDATERPELVYPVDVTLEDDTVQTLLDSDELASVRSSCKKGKDRRKCFKLVLPVSFTMEDGTVIEVTERADYKLLREWKKANPDSTVKPAKIFPLDIEYRDGTIETIADETAYEAAKDSCSI
ncbi:hypothetical protein BW723_00595 [Polaribacter reichenbachii]|uniref:Lipoprotein n=1 Tax=Polaribacter reichenbachii TaxID=996801 RepID=A0A1B8U4R3_9FLAO|nr:hypothetical protein [Polaribacter reichenbachii]APZ44874.1 hypothetical protein BW723_00595 [Polaribacter reichenbachii]AUC18738.1 hypothetical protein BTO17_08600 [Polaribacter reichenbachii]OBY66852.1 hypothetical protein LPB301_05340 [Polaribacter reichenbachii]